MRCFGDLFFYANLLLLFFLKDYSSLLQHIIMPTLFLCIGIINYLFGLFICLGYFLIHLF